MNLQQIIRRHVRECAGWADMQRRRKQLDELQAFAREWQAECDDLRREERGYDGWLQDEDQYQDEDQGDEQWDAE